MIGFAPDERLAAIADGAMVDGENPTGGAGVMIGARLYSDRDRGGGAGVLNSYLPPQLLACYYFGGISWLAVWPMDSCLLGCVMFPLRTRQGS